MIVLSLFDGISCGRLALERAGVQVDRYYASEVDPYAIKISGSNWPDIVQLGNVEDWRSWDLGHVDLIIGGSPCQGFSTLGEMDGLDHAGSRLFWDFYDIVEHYGCDFLLENVRLSSEDCDHISGLMGVEPYIINSKGYVPQSRTRMYWTSWDWVPPSTVGGGVLDDILLANWYVEDRYYYPDRECKLKGHVVHKRDRGWIPGGPVAQCLIAGYWKGIDNYGARSFLSDARGVRRLTPIEFERLQGLPDSYTSCVSDTHRYQTVGNGWTLPVIVDLIKGK